jgi:choline-sulfatase
MSVRKSLVLLTIDAWRADFADVFEGVPLLPSLAPYAPHTARLTRLWANGPWTTPAIVSLLTGEDVFQHGVHYAWSKPRPDTVGLPRVLAEQGFHTPDLCYLNRVDNYHHLGYPPDTAPPHPAGVDDPVIFDAIEGAARGVRGSVRTACDPSPSLAPGVARSARSDAPSFLWYHYKFVHLPYWPEAPFRRLFGVEEVPENIRQSVSNFIAPREDVSLDPAWAATIRRLYAANVRQMDAWLGRVLAHLRATGLDATVVITADHGDELLEHGHVGHASTAHDGRLFDEILRIPCFVIDDRITGPRVLDHRVEGRDLFPTLLGLAGVPCPPTTAVDFSGAILRGEAPAADPQRVFAFHTSAWGYRTAADKAHDNRSALTDGRWKYLKTLEDECLYDLEADPGEQCPLRDEAALMSWRARLGRRI